MDLTTLQFCSEMDQWNFTTIQEEDIISNTILTTEAWRSIEVSRSGRSGSLIVNNQIPVTRESPEGYCSLQLNGNLLIGRLVSEMRIPDELGTVQHFYGCMREL